MKFTKIELNNYQQFKNLEIDLTYPIGHKKEGQPLDKVCIIGQSGTGKTTLLRLLMNTLSCMTHTSLTASDKDLYGEAIFDMIDLNKNQTTVTVIKHNLGDEISFVEKLQIPFRQQFKNKMQCLAIYYSSETILNSAVQRLESRIHTNPAQILDFDKINGFESIKLLEQRIKLYRTAYSNILVNLGQGITEGKNIDFKNELLKWQSENENPIEAFATSVLDPIINKFNLKTKLTFDNVNQMDLQVEHISTGKIIPFDNLSTGTKQVICTAIPLYELRTNGTVVLFDEPERSLYPDVQADMIKLYSKLAPNAQFFYATHSAMVLSNFEPWEIVELKFDMNDPENIVQDLYYKNDRHVDNYFVDPRIMRWDKIYQKIYDYDQDGNSEFRIPILMQLAQLEGKLKHLKANGNVDEATLKTTWEEYSKISERMGWERRTANEKN